MTQKIKIGSQTIGPDFPPFVVAELSGNHNGSLERAKELIRAAKDAGASAVKLQTYTADTLTLDKKDGEFLIEEPTSLWKGKNLYELYQQASTPWEWHESLFEFARSLGLVIFSSPFDETAIDFLETLDVPCYKIASPEIVDLPLIVKAAATGKPLLISTGGASVVEIDEAVAAARQAGCQEIVLLKCTMAYPASPEDVHLRTMVNLSETFGTLVGLSDHTLGIGVSIASIALGGCVIEKHFTMARSEGGIDSAFSMEPHEFKLMVEEAKKAWQSLGKVHYGPLPSEKTSFSHRPSLYFTQDIEAGTVITDQHIRSVRPGKGLPPKEMPHVLGLRVVEAIKKGTPVSWSHFHISGDNPE